MLHVEFNEMAEARPPAFSPENHIYAVASVSMTVCPFLGRVGGLSQTFDISLF